MYINNTSYIENIKCENCKNQDICKWTSLMATMNGNVDKMTENKEFNCPIKVKVTCNNFEKKSQRQDGINSWDFR